MDNREKLELLRETVLAAAQRSAEETEAETKRIIEDTVSSEKKRLSDEIAEIKSMSYDELRNRDEKELIAKDSKLKKNLLVRREEYMRELFAELESRLIGFCKTDGYEKYLKRAYSTAVDKFGKPDIAYCAKGEKELCQAVISEIPFEEDSSLRLGGVIFGKANLLLDLSFDSRVEKEKEFFINGGNLRFE